ncbi:CENP-V/GFA domain-containing protein [Fusarium sp. LHS14.1]|nr:CENP-V/GFA domain-containing protein [Fusarium sp. LHS14.1]
MASVNSGSCLCGACTYSYTDEPAMKAVCYCSTCRKVSGGTNTTNFIVPEERFTLNSGQPKSFSTEHETGMIIKLFFCSDCGTTMWKEASAPQFKGVKIVQAGTLTDPTNFTGKIDVELYAPERASWLVALQGAEQKEQL